MKAKDLMIQVQDYLKPDDTLKDAVNLLKVAKRGEERIGVKGLPVLDESGKLVGMLSMRDILKAVHPTYMDLMNVGAAVLVVVNLSHSPTKWVKLILMIGTWLTLCTGIHNTGDVVYSAGASFPMITPGHQASYLGQE